MNDCSLPDTLHRLGLQCNIFDSGEHLIALDMTNLLWLFCHESKDIIPILKYPKNNPIATSLQFPKVQNMFELKKGNFKLHGVSLSMWSNNTSCVVNIAGRLLGDSSRPFIKMLPGDELHGIWLSKYSNISQNNLLPQEVKNKVSVVHSNNNHITTSFELWWNQDHVLHLNNEKYSRKDVVGWARNKACGSHKEKNENDPNLKKYRVLETFLASNKELTFIYPQPKSLLYSGIYALIRTIAGELIFSLNKNNTSVL